MITYNRTASIVSNKVLSGCHYYTEDDSDITYLFDTLNYEFEEYTSDSFITKFLTFRETSSAVAKRVVDKYLNTYKLQKI